MPRKSTSWWRSCLRARICSADDLSKQLTRAPAVLNFGRRCMHAGRDIKEHEREESKMTVGVMTTGTDGAKLTPASYQLLSHIIARFGYDPPASETLWYKANVLFAYERGVGGRHNKKDGKLFAPARFQQGDLPGGYRRVCSVATKDRVCFGATMQLIYPAPPQGRGRLRRCNFLQKSLAGMKTRCLCKSTMHNAALVRRCSSGMRV